MSIDLLAFTKGTVFIDYPFEEVKFHYANGRVYRKFYGEQKETEIPPSSTLFHDAIASGQEISGTEYKGE